MDAAVTKAITAIDEQAWTPIRYPQAGWGEKAPARSPTPRSPRPGSPRSPPAACPTTFPPGPRPPGQAARPDSVPAGQEQMFRAYWYHAVFTDSPLPMIAAEADHRRHAVRGTGPGSPWARTVRRHLRPTRSGLTPTSRPTRPDQKPSVEQPDRPADHPRPSQPTKIKSGVGALDEDQLESGRSRHTVMV
jgi:hypothetical protein